MKKLLQRFLAIFGQGDASEEIRTGAGGSTEKVPSPNIDGHSPQTVRLSGQMNLGAVTSETVNGSVKERSASEAIESKADKSGSDLESGTIPSAEVVQSRKAEFSLDARKKVSTLQSEFFEAFGMNIRIYKGQRFAPDVPIRELTEPGRPGGRISFGPQTLVKTVERRFEEEFGLKIQVEAPSGELADNKATIASVRVVDSG